MSYPNLGVAMLLPWLIRRWLGPPVPEGVRKSRDFQSMSPDSRKRFLLWREKRRLPAIELKIIGRPSDLERGGTKVGGPVWIPERHQWPTDENGERLNFLAQLDFDQLPKIEDFPKRGVIQFFILKDPWEAVGTMAEDLGFRVFYHPDLKGPGKFERSDQPIGEPVGGKLLLDDVLLHGLAFKGTQVFMAPNYGHHFFQNEMLNGLSEEETEKLCSVDQDLHHHGADLTIKARYYIGGYPYVDQFVNPDHSHYDRLLLSLWMDGELAGISNGTLHIEIPRDDLRTLDFSRRFLTYDDT